MRCLGCSDGESTDGSCYCSDCYNKPERWVRPERWDIYPYVICEVCGEPFVGDDEDRQRICFMCHNMNMLRIEMGQEPIR